MTSSKFMILQYVVKTEVEHLDVSEARWLEFAAAGIARRRSVYLPIATKKLRPKKQAKEKSPMKYVLEKLVCEGIVDGRIFYKVRWAGFAARYDTWESRTALCEDGHAARIRKFKKAHARKR